MVGEVMAAAAPAGVATVREQMVARVAAVMVREQLPSHTSTVGSAQISGR